MVLGITGAAYAQSGAGGAAGAESAGMGVGGGGIAGQAGGEMSGMSKAVPGLGQRSPMSEQGVPGLEGSVEPRAGAAPGVDLPPGKNRTSRASPRVEGSGSIGGESTGMGVGSSREQGASRRPSVPRY
jgi:hypothetical protein